jgi:hypothetical protein
MDTLKTPFGNFNVYINRLTAPKENIFHVSFVDKQNKTNTFLMHFNSEQWVFSDPSSVPSWFTEFEPELNNLITKECLKDFAS